MAEQVERDSKTEEPTENKLREAVEKGNVPVSREAATFASLLGILVVASFLVAEGAVRLNASLRQFIDDPGGWSLENSADAVHLFEAIGSDAARLLVPAVVVLAAAGVLASLLQNPPQLVFNRIQPDLSRLSLAKGWRRVFGSVGQVEFLKAAVKFALVGALGFMLLRSVEFDVLNAMFMEPGALPELIRGVSVRLLSWLLMISAALVAADLAWSRLSWRRELRMSRQEVKDELKQMEGDPLLKARMRSLARHRARKRMIGAVPRATLVIANPTHYAVALRYVREEGGAPLVIAKGQDFLALKIREIATRHDIPVIEDKPLARSLYQSVEVDKFIPPQFYKAVAEIILALFVRRAPLTRAG
jgi:flagellar biosynthetic protein FlhB